MLLTLFLFFGVVALGALIGYLMPGGNRRQW